ncbi:hypothetical protein AKJ64_04230 [candidate division MSBL1 archaeon SCGC-AAA259E17]|uniref:Radical SAM core domain-containing protein n=1 Tax=candidate division MSBL1 archaeon SCGC-AAA259E17 TaxID=1698263 RepID=A0A133UCW4_9EURY|nr:hypothetical protein AKJ64_04230 [candidate division MSBL1 archaeon SCGC-AAA259E17]
MSSSLPLCLDCIRETPEKALEIAAGVHSKAREEIGLPPRVPKNSEGIECSYCANNCRIPRGGRGYCNLSKNKEGRLTRKLGTPEKAVGSWYRDPHPTNCVAAWCCAGGSGSEYPDYAKTPAGDRGYKNAAVFLGACCYHCLYCQNARWREMASSREPVLERNELVEEISSDRSITCLCWFGGTPEPQSPFVYEVSKRIRERAEEKGRIFRICLEANGNFSWPRLKRIAEISLESGGGIKFDLKAWNENLNRVLSGVGNEPTYDNFERLGELHAKRKEPPFLRASTLLVPGYIDLKEIRNIASFISEVDPTIPYSLLAYGPAYMLGDLPTTEKEFAFRAKDVAEGEGVERVMGNKHLLR